MRHLFLAVAATAILLAPPVAAEPTEIVVRVLSKDAKFIGTSMGGMRVTLRDADTGEVLATGVTEGTTGDTKLLMHDNGGRRARLSDDNSAKFAATLDLAAPRLVEAEVFGPLAQRQAAQRAVSTQWIIPGRGSGVDGWVIEVPGFVVDVLAPPAHVRIGDTAEVEVRANIVTMCGCPIEPGGIWDADKYEVRAIVSRNGKEVTRVPLRFAGQTSQFVGTVPVDGSGFYDVLVYAHDAATGNAGVDRTTFIADRK